MQSCSDWALCVPVIAVTFQCDFRPREDRVINFEDLTDPTSPYRQVGSFHRNVLVGITLEE